MMPRRTPVTAIVLAPVVTYALYLLWVNALVPLYRAVRYSDTFAQWRLDSDVPAARIGAVETLGKSGSANPRLLGELVERLRNDDSLEVRKAAAAALGRLGSTSSLGEPATTALSELVLNAPDDATLDAAISAVGQSAAHNRYDDVVVTRIAAILAGQHLAWLYSRAATALGQIGAAQALPANVSSDLNRLFAEPGRPGEREYLANAFTEIAKGGRLADTTLDVIADTLAGETNRRIRTSIIYALAYSAKYYPRAKSILSAATGDADRDVARAAESGLRIIEANRVFADTDPLSLAMDTSRPVNERLQGLQVIRSRKIEPETFAAIASLSRDSDVGVVTAALEIFPHLARAPNAAFDRNVLIPALDRAMSHADLGVRKAAISALSIIAVRRPDYPAAADFPARIETAANDADAGMRLLAFSVMFRAASSTAAKDAVIDRAFGDGDPYVRANATTWLGSEKTQTDNRKAFIDRALQDHDPNVRAAARTSQQRWDNRSRAWPVELWQSWSAGEHEAVGMRILIAVTVMVPAVIGVIFLVYYVARLITYTCQRRWRAIALVPVLAVWIGASYGMFMLYFMAAHAGGTDSGEILKVAAVLWIGVAIYAALGWGMHFAVRR